MSGIKMLLIAYCCRYEFSYFIQDARILTLAAL